ncbi:unnamed protein product [Somion occarium]|uniref:Uncharacterized protein n=1 Tax=Somion occarium TaxID=3059160 RepID=A0ABP1E2P8_9APHY
MTKTSINGRNGSQTSRRKARSLSTSNSSAASQAMKASAVENLKARERKLREDPMVIIHSPKRVQCNRCGVEIQLSKKSDFDPCHWNKHRERCLKKRPNDDVKNKKLHEAGGRIRQSTWPTAVRVVTRRASSLSSYTPSLSPDVDEQEEPLSPLTSIASDEPPSPTISPQSLVVTPKPEHIELPSVTSPAVIVSPKPMHIQLPTIVPPAVPVPSRRSPFTLDYRPIYDSHLGTPLDHPPTEYFRWSQLRTSYRSPSRGSDTSPTVGTPAIAIPFEVERLQSRFSDWSMPQA